MKPTTTSLTLSLCLSIALSTTASCETFRKDITQDDNPPPNLIIIPRPENIIGLRIDDNTGVVTAVSEEENPAGFPYIMGQIDFNAEVIDPETGEVLCNIGDYFQNPE